MRLAGFIRLLSVPIGAACLLLLVAPEFAAAATLQTFYSFCAKSGCPDGAQPVAPLVADSDGNLFGVTSANGTCCGTVFELAHNAATDKYGFKTLYRFCRQSNCTDGSHPKGSLVVDTSGNLYGTTLDGGQGNYGTIFELRPPTATRRKWSLHILYDFCAAGPPCPDGANPYAGLAYPGRETGAPYDGTSPLFGAAAFGGEGYFGQGVIYRVTPAGKRTSYKVLYTFCPQGNCLATGAMPYGRLTLDASGNLYGTTQAYGPNGGGGTVFRLHWVKGGWKLGTLYSFCHASNCADGYAPMSELVRDSSGNLYGTTLSGGVNGNSGYGVVFKLAPDGTYTVLHALNGTTDGSEPYGGLALDDHGNLFGAASAGGNASTQAGTLFELKRGRTFVVLHTFCANGCTDGAIPMATPLLDSAGRLLGTTSAGGAHATGGTVFRLTP